MLQDSLTILTWKDVKAQVAAVNPEFAQNVETIPNVEDYVVVRARYPFGAPLVDAGKFYLYINGQSVPYESPLVPKALRQHFDYFWKCLPFGIIMRGGFENYTRDDDYLIPSRQLKVGNTFSKIIIFDDPLDSHFLAKANSVVSGSRGLFILSRLDDPIGNHELAEYYKLTQSLYPGDFSAQWVLFRSLLNTEQLAPCEVIYFSKDFFFHNKELLVFRDYLLTEFTVQASFLRNEFSYSFVFERFLKSFPSALKQDHIIILTTWHIIKSIVGAIGHVALFSPVPDDSITPIDFLDYALVKVYGLKQLPIYMATTYYDNLLPVYYSLQRPIFLYPLSGQTDKNTVATLKAIKSIIAQFKEFCYRYGDDRDVLFGTPMYERLKKVEFDFFHPKGGAGIRSDIETIFAEDPRFTNRFKDKPEYKGLSLPLDSEFFKGCIRLRPLAEKAQSHHIKAVTLQGEAVELTPREYQCFELAAQRKTSKEMGVLLGDISPRTVETHLERLYKKLGCQYKSQLETVWQLQKRR